MLFFSIFDEPIHLVRKQLNEFNTLMNLELKDIAWNAAIIVDEYSPDRIRKDACGAWIAYDDFNNKESMFGWEIDHVYPTSRLNMMGIPRKLWNHPLNIRAMHWKNNFSKANSFPQYTSAVVDCGFTNMQQNSVFWVSEELQDELNRLFKIR